MQTLKQINCPCQSGQLFKQCCEPYLNGSLPAPNPERLMRSRFSAFVMGNASYLVKTHHPDYRESNESEALEKSFTSVRWLSLEIINCQQNLKEQGTVEFKASFIECDALQPSLLHERSEFIKLDGQWYYTKGNLYDTAQPSIGRNDSCWCGSGKKFKRCHQN